MPNIEKKDIEWEKNKQPEKIEKHEVTKKSELLNLKAEIVTDKEQKEAEMGAEKLVSEWISWDKKGAEKKQENANLDLREIKKIINTSNRPEDVKKGIEQSYTTIDNTIKNSKNEKWIAGFLGKIMNKILGQ